MFSEGLGFAQVAAAGKHWCLLEGEQRALPWGPLAASVPQEPMLFLLVGPCRGDPEQGMGCTGNRTEAWLRRGFSVNKEQGRGHYFCVQQGCFRLPSPPSSPIAKRGWFQSRTWFWCWVGFFLFFLTGVILQGAFGCWKPQWDVPTSAEVLRVAPPGLHGMPALSPAGKV